MKLNWPFAIASAAAMGCATDPPVDPPEAQSARANLVRRIETRGTPWEGSGPWDTRVLAALLKVPRHQFMPKGSLAQAYGDHPNPIGHGQTISQPTIVAIMSTALKLTGSERVLEIGTGSGYQAAILSLLAREVYSIEIVPELGLAAKTRLADLGYRNVEVHIGDGYLGLPSRAPFERIILTAAPPSIPTALLDQLADAGILVAPIGEASKIQVLVRWTKKGETLIKEDLGAVRFVPMVTGPGTPPQP